MMVFVCNDIEEGWYRRLAEECQREQRAYERDELLLEEAQLGYEALLDAEDDDCDPDEYLPAYAPRPYEIQWPEIFEL